MYLVEDLDYPEYQTCGECGEEPTSIINWVIAGGESGPSFRPMNLDWPRDLRDQCLDAEVPFFYKQDSGPRPGMNDTLDGREWKEMPV